MDVFFHGVAGTLLASSLGERRRTMLAAAAIVGMAPDIIWVAGGPLGLHLRPLSHSLWFAAVAVVLTAGLNWRVALAYPLHVLVDIPVHVSSGFWAIFHLRGINWWQGAGRMVTLALWVVLLTLAAVHIRRLRRARAAAPVL